MNRIPHEHGNLSLNLKFIILHSVGTFRVHIILDKGITQWEKKIYINYIFICEI